MIIYLIPVRTGTVQYMYIYGESCRNRRLSKSSANALPGDSGSPEALSAHVFA